MSLLQEPEVRSQLKALGRAFLLLAGLCAGVVVLYLIFLWDIQLFRYFREAGLTELTQSAMLAATAGLYALEAYRRPCLRHAMVLVAGFFGCMLIREQDYFLDFISHGFWLWPALALAFGCIAYACTDLRRTLAGLEHFVRWKYFPFLIIGLVIVLAYSRLFGSRMGWELLLGKRFVYSMKSGVEESSELLGYLFILASAILANTDKRLK
ncbi:MAG: hypothetical protein IJD65_05785 [Mailhella sp.]|nr:hypothetical protein [Mailhella sp.]